MKPSQWMRVLLMLAHALKTQPSLDYVFAVSGWSWPSWVMLTLLLAGFGHLISRPLMKMPLQRRMVGWALLSGLFDAGVTVGLLFGISFVTPPPLGIIALSSAVWFGVWLPLLALLWPLTLLIRMAEAKQADAKMVP